MTSREALAIGTDTKPPVLFKGEYEQWKDRFLNFVDKHELGDFIRQSIEEGVMKLVMMTRMVGTVPTQIELKYHELEDDNLKRAKGDKLAKSYILQGIPNEIYVKIDSYKASGKEMWDQLEKMMLGSKVGNQLKLSNCLNNYEEFKGRSGESLEGTDDRFVTLLNEPSKKKMKQIKDLNEIPLHEVYETLKQNEEEVDEILDEKRKEVKPVEDTVALVVKKKKKKKTIKKFCKKPSSNSQRYSSGPNNYVHKERVEGSRYEGKKFERKRIEEKKPEKRRYHAEGKRIEEKKPEKRRFQAE
ncbi:hypothetical protein L6452_06039 [Arctium lappa]|uniref:Uncharacterized protein n=1 Tax=Arctium lappa TaxID=4217 RepID=A0ACB9EIC6_ARCLA|nr:hypothetical protein L6452_06039 [Arctium lappa]